MRYIQIVGEMFLSAGRNNFKIHIHKKYFFVISFLSQQHSTLHTLVFPLCLHFNMWTPACYRGPGATRQLTLEPRGVRVDKECHHSPQGGTFSLSLARCICFLSEQQDSEGERAALRCGVLILETKSLSDSDCFITHQSDGGSWQRENTQIGPA